MRLAKTISLNPNRPIDFFELTERSDYKEWASLLRKKYGISEEGYDLEEDQSFIDFLNDKKLKKEVGVFVKKLGLGSSWTNVVLENVVLGIYYSHDSTSESILKNSDGLMIRRNTKNQKYIEIRVGPDAKKKDFHTAWAIISDMRKNTPTRRVRKKDMHLRNVMVIQLAKKGHTISDIATKINNSFPSKDGIDPGNIKKIVSEYKKKTKSENSSFPKLRT